MSLPLHRRKRTAVLAQAGASPRRMFGGTTNSNAFIIPAMRSK